MWSKALIALSSCTLFAQGARHKRSGSGQIAGVRVHKDSVEAEDFLILFRRGATDAMIKEVCQGQCTFEGHPSRGGVAFAKVHGRAVVEKILTANSQHVDLVEVDSWDSIIPDFEVAGAQIQSAPWGLGRIGKPEAAYTGKDVNIFIQDTGVRSTHTDFGGRVIPTLDMTQRGGLKECDGTGKCANDGQGHGTHCAGSAAGATYGVATQATIRSVKTLSDSGSGQRSWQMEAIDWIATSEIPRPAVLSMSLGGSGQDSSYTTSIVAATESGVTVVVAAGNDNNDACGYSPAFEKTAITVGSTDSRDVRSYFSNYGECVQIWAPGSDIESADAFNDDGSKTFSGTSMACPHVSGGVALLFEEKPGLGGDLVLTTLFERSEKGAIADLKPADINSFLWVGRGPAPVPAPTPAPPPSVCPGYCSAWYHCFYSDCLDCDFCSR